jgi:hypothetical protein
MFGGRPVRVVRDEKYRSVAFQYPAWHPYCGLPDMADAGVSPPAG